MHPYSYFYIGRNLYHFGNLLLDVRKLLLLSLSLEDTCEESKDRTPV